MTGTMTDPAVLVGSLSPGERRALLARLLSRRAARQGSAPMSFAQERLWFLDRLQPGLPVYNIPAAFGLPGPVDVDALRRSLDEIVRRHEALRTLFGTEGEKPVQLIQPSLRTDVAEHDLRPWPAELRDAELQRIARQAARQPFDLTRGPLLRAVLVHRSDAASLLLLTMHHIVADGWSMSVFHRELAALYGTFCQGRPSPLPELPLQYADYARWQRDWLRGETLEKLRSYWKEALEGSPDLLDLPTDRPRPAVQTFAGSTLSLRLGRAVAEGVKTLAQSRRATPFMVFLAAFAAILHLHAGQDRVNLGSPIAGRTRSELEPLIGLFINTLVLSVDVAGDPAFQELLARVKEVTLGAYAHQDLPFEKLVEDLRPKRSLSHNALFQVMISLQNDPLAMPRVGEGPVESSRLDTGTAKFDLTLFLTEAADGLLGSVEFNTDLFDPATVQRLVDRFQAFVAGALRNPGAPLSALPLLTEAERQSLLVWNDTAVPLPGGCLHQLVEAQAERTPDGTALLWDGGELTYGQVERRANRLAAALRRLGVGPESRVGVCLERSPELVVTLLGVLKAGGAYVPLDPSYPQERLAFMLRDSGAGALVTSRDLLDTVPDAGAGLLLVEELAGAESPERPSALTATAAAAQTAEHLAYVLYTSGSTGRPKGVAVPHGAIVNTLGAMAAAAPLLAGDRVLLKTAISFDASVWELFAPLAAGATLVVAPPQAHRDVARLLGEIMKHRVTVIQVVPSMLRVLLQDHRLGECRSLRLVFSGGEPLPRKLAERLAARLDARLLNVYGPAEAAVDATWGAADGEAPGATVPIGRPIANMRVHLLGGHLAPVPVGVPGEIYLAGPGLARGYQGQPGLTAEQFLPDPFSPVPGGRLYRTGDLARHLPDCRLQFLGRLGAQVKLRGIRIELGEIEAVLARHPRVREAAVLLQDGESGDPRLSAYVATADGGAADPAELRSFLRAKLPEHMVPASFVSLPALPRLPNGKLDRAVLPTLFRDPGPAEHVLPRNPTEDVLSRIWSALLRIERIGVEESFFDLGGHSLLATQVISRVRDAFGVEIPLHQFFESPTVAGLAAIVRELEGHGGAADVPLPPGRLVDGLAPDAAEARDRAWPSSGGRPRSPLEQRLAGLWQEVLGREVDAGSDFFALGGDPALAERLLSKLQQELDADVPLPAFLQAPTVPDLAAAVVERRLRRETAADAEEMLAEVEALSEERAEAALAELSPG